jgi:hypothetical protein
VSRGGGGGGNCDLLLRGGGGVAQGERPRKPMSEGQSGSMGLWGSAAIWLSLGRLWLFECLWK